MTNLEGSRKRTHPLLLCCLPTFPFFEGEEQSRERQAAHWPKKFHFGFLPDEEVWKGRNRVKRSFKGRQRRELA